MTKDHTTSISQISSPLLPSAVVASSIQNERNQIPFKDLESYLSNNTSGRLIRFITEWYKKFMAPIELEAMEFRNSLISDDVLLLKRARFLFHLCSILPPLAYYFGRGSLAVDRPPKFPATISFTIRKGLPKKIQTVLWTAGWVLMYRVIHRRTKPIAPHTQPSLLRRYCLQMIGTGVWTTEVFRLGTSDPADVCHFLGAAKYMLDHIVMMDVLKMKPLHRKSFFWSFGMLILNFGAVHSIESFAGIAKESDNRFTTAQRARQISQKLSPYMRSRLFASELLVMLFENLLFSSFVQGIPIGIEEEVLKRNKERAPKQKCETDNKMATTPTIESE